MKSIACRGDPEGCESAGVRSWTRSLSAFLLCCLAASHAGARSATPWGSPLQESAASSKESDSSATAPATSDSEPFAWGDFTWLNGNDRRHAVLLDSKVFTGEFLPDANYPLVLQRYPDPDLPLRPAEDRTLDHQRMAVLYCGTDTRDHPDRIRVHSDHGVEIRYSNRPEDFIDRAAFSVTQDAGLLFDIA